MMNQDDILPFIPQKFEQKPKKPEQKPKKPEQKPKKPEEIILPPQLIQEMQESKKQLEDIINKTNDIRNKPIIETTKVDLENLNIDLINQNKKIQDVQNIMKQNITKHENLSNLEKQISELGEKIQLKSKYVKIPILEYILAKFNYDMTMQMKNAINVHLIQIQNEQGSRVKRFLNRSQNMKNLAVKKTKYSKQLEELEQKEFDLNNILSQANLEKNKFSPTPEEIKELEDKFIADDVKKYLDMTFGVMNFEEIRTILEKIDVDYEKTKKAIEDEIEVQKNNILSDENKTEDEEIELNFFDFDIDTLDYIINIQNTIRRKLENTLNSLTDKNSSEYKKLNNLYEQYYTSVDQLKTEKRNKTPTGQYKVSINILSENELGNFTYEELIEKLNEVYREMKLKLKPEEKNDQNEYVNKHKETKQEIDNLLKTITQQMIDHANDMKNDISKIFYLNPTAIIDKAVDNAVEMVGGEGVTEVTHDTDRAILITVTFIIQMISIFTTNALKKYNIVNSSQMETYSNLGIYNVLTFILMWVINCETIDKMYIMSYLLVFNIIYLLFITKNEPKEQKDNKESHQYSLNRNLNVTWMILSTISIFF